MTSAQSPAFDYGIIHHFPPDVFKLLVDTIPLLCRSKPDVLTFFSGAGVPFGLMQDVHIRVQNNRDEINKFEIARTILTRLNEQDDLMLRQRREVIKRAVEFEDFSQCWPNDQYKAKGLVSELQRIVNVKDSFSRMKTEHERERQKRQEEAQKELLAIQKHNETLASIKADLYALFAEKDAHKRGKALEKVLNQLFNLDGILVKESFTLKGWNNEGIIEQIDGAVEIDGVLYLVEMKWWKDPIGVPEVSQHLVRVYNRDKQVRGIFISYSDYTEPAITTCRESIGNGCITVLSTLQELICLLETSKPDVKGFFKRKIQAALIEKQPFYPFNAEVG